MPRPAFAVGFGIDQMLIAQRFLLALLVVQPDVALVPPERLRHPMKACAIPYYSDQWTDALAPVHLLIVRSFTVLCKTMNLNHRKQMLR
jgi:hypothetical protein